MNLLFGDQVRLRARIANLRLTSSLLALKFENAIRPYGEQNEDYLQTMIDKISILERISRASELAIGVNIDTLTNIVNNFERQFDNVRANRRMG